MTTNSYFHGAFSHIPPTTSTNTDDDRTECLFSRSSSTTKRKTYDDRMDGSDEQPEKYPRLLDDDLVNWTFHSDNDVEDPFVTEEVISLGEQDGLIMSSIFDTPPATPTTPTALPNSLFDCSLARNEAEQEFLSVEHVAEQHQQEQHHQQEPQQQQQRQQRQQQVEEDFSVLSAVEEEPASTSGPLLTSDSIPSPVKRELTPSERNNIITSEMIKMVKNLSRGQSIMILSPERNRHKSYDIPRKDITALASEVTHSDKKGSQELKIGSGSEKKFKYFLHILFKEKQSRVPNLELTKGGTPVEGGLKIHHSWLLEGGLIVRYSMSFQVNSFEHDRSAFCICAKDSDDNTLSNSVPFVLVARKTNDCLFHMKVTTRRKQKRSGGGSGARK